MKEIKEIIKKIESLNYQLMEKTQERLDSLTKPQGSLGRLEELAKQIVGITRKENPTIKNKVIFTLAGDHGVTKEKISAYPKDVTAQMVYNFIRGGAGINILAKHIGAKVVVVDMGVAEKINPSTVPCFDKLSIALKRVKRVEGLRVDGEQSRTIKNKKSTLRLRSGLMVSEVEPSKIKNFKDRKINYGTKNFTKGPAMSRDEAIKSIEAGIELVEEEMPNGIDIIGTGDMGIGNTTASSAIAAVFINKSIEELTGKGTGIDDTILKNKIEIIKKALEINKPNADDAIDVLSKVGGYEIGGLAGIILAGAAKRIPIVIDGFISGAACLLAYNLESKIKNYCIASHCSKERGHRVILDYLGLKPLLDLEMRLGEGTGACLGINLVEAAVKILTQMATFRSARVSEKIK